MPTDTINTMTKNSVKNDKNNSKLGGVFYFVPGTTDLLNDIISGQNEAVRVGTVVKVESISTTTLDEAGPDNAISITPTRYTIADKLRQYQVDDAQLFESREEALDYSIEQLQKLSAINSMLKNSVEQLKLNTTAAKPKARFSFKSLWTK